MVKTRPIFQPNAVRSLAGGLLVVISLISLSACLEAAPTETDPEAPTVSDAPSDTIGFQDPSVPIINPGSGLPDFGNGTVSTDEEVDCDNAEDLCDSGAWACDDIADYCDIGPDDGSDIPDDWDWDQ